MADYTSVDVAGVPVWRLESLACIWRPPVHDEGKIGENFNCLLVPRCPPGSQFPRILFVFRSPMSPTRSLVLPDRRDGAEKSNVS